MSDDINPDTLDAVLETEDKDPVASEEEITKMFESGFAGEEPKADEDPVEDTPDAEVKPDENQEVETDPEKDKAPDTQGKEEPKEEKGEVDLYAKRLRSLEAKFGTLNSKYLNLSKQKEQEVAPKAPTAEEVREAIRDEDKLEALRKEYPDDPYIEAIDANNRMLKREIAKQLEPLQNRGAFGPEDAADLTSKAMDQARQSAIVDIKHPSWENTVSTKEFTDWKDAQSEEVKALYVSDSGHDVVELLDLFEKSKNPAPEPIKPKDRLKSSITPTSRSSVPRQTQVSADDAFAAGFKEVRS